MCVSSAVNTISPESLSSFNLQTFPLASCPAQNISELIAPVLVENTKKKMLALAKPPPKRAKIFLLPDILVCLAFAESN